MTIEYSLTYNLAYKQGVASKNKDKNPYSEHTAPAWHHGWKDGHNMKHSKDCELKERLMKNAQKALREVQSDDQNVNAMYNVVRYAKAGLYEVKGTEDELH